MVKRLIAKEQEKHLEDEDNEVAWMEGKYTASERRILVTHWVGEAIKHAHKLNLWRYFERCGAMMTVDGTDDELITLEGAPRDWKMRREDLPLETARALAKKLQAKRDAKKHAQEEAAEPAHESKAAEEHHGTDGAADRQTRSQDDTLEDGQPHTVDALAPVEDNRHAPLALLCTTASPDDEDEELTMELHEPKSLVDLLSEEGLRVDGTNARSFAYRPIVFLVPGDGWTATSVAKTHGQNMVDTHIGKLHLDPKQRVRAISDDSDAVEHPYGSWALCRHVVS